MKRLKHVLFLFVCILLLTSCKTDKNQSLSLTVTQEKISQIDDATTTEKNGYTIRFDLNGGSSNSYVSSKEISNLSPEFFFFDCKKEGYNFRGWKYQEKLIFDEKGNIIDEIKLSEGMIFTATYVETAKLSIVTNLPDGGYISGGKECEYYTTCDIFAKPNKGYNFLGWYQIDNETLDYDILIATEETYKFLMWTEDVTIQAKFELANFTLSLKSNNKDNGLIVDTNYSRTPFEHSEYEHQYLSKTTISAISITDEYRFLGWYDEENCLISPNAVYTFDMINRDYELTAKWDYFKIVYDLSGGTLSEKNPEFYTTSSTNIELASSQKIGYDFIGWYENGEPFNGFTGRNEDLHLTATYEVHIYTVTLDPNGGSVDGGLVYEITYGESLMLPIPKTPELNVSIYTIIGNDNYKEPKFVGWECDGFLYSGSDGKIEKWESTRDVVLIAKYEGTIAIDKVSTSILFGSYPQSEVYDSEIISSLNSKAGINPNSSNMGEWVDYGYYADGKASSYMFYIDIDNDNDGSYDYRGVYLTDYRSIDSRRNASYWFNYQSGNGYNTNIVYWFKYEPIKWDILKIEDDKAMIVSQLLLDSQPYDNALNSYYDKSYIRKWLNETFYETAFDGLEKTIIETTNVDNSRLTTGDSNNPYACANTDDKMFLLSYSEVSTFYPNTESKMAKPSQYAKSQGIRYVPETDSSCWLLRSPAGDGYGWSIKMVDDTKRTGNVIGNEAAFGTFYGIRPVCWIKLYK